MHGEGTARSWIRTEPEPRILSYSQTLPDYDQLIDLVRSAERSFPKFLEYWESDIRKNIDVIGHFHSAGVPSRNELYRGETDYPFVLGQIEELGYGGGIRSGIPALGG